MGVLEAVFQVFTSIGSWFTGFIPTLFALFWTPAASGDGGSLTILGVMAVCGLGFGIVCLCLGLVQRFFHWGG